jgi:hypothetical protein
VWAGAVLIICTALYPPWVSVLGPSGDLKRPIGYYWIFSPPTEGFVSVDILRLLLEWAIVLAISAAFFLATPTITVSDGVRNEIRSLRRNREWLTEPLGLLAIIVIIGLWVRATDTTAHRLSVWEVVCLALAITLFSSLRAMWRWLRRLGIELAFLFVIGLAGILVMGVTEALNARAENETTRLFLHLIGYESWRGLVFLSLVVLVVVPLVLSLLRDK